ncbi:MAG: DUF1501 domain-containing protein [Acidobacteriota bacterium]
MLNRRAFMKAGGLSLLTLGAGPRFLERTAWAAAAPGAMKRRKVLVTIFQRGAMDGLAAVSPRGDPRLAKLRPRLVVGADRRRGGELHDLGVGFGLHPGLSDLLPFFKEGQLGIVHCVGSPDPTRSHFDAQDYMEAGTPGRKGTPDGWLNRVAGHLGHDTTPFRAVSITPSLPRSLYGEHPALAVTDLRHFKVDLPGVESASKVAGRGFEALYDDASEELLRGTAQETFEAVDMLEKLDVSRYRPSADAGYPRSPLGLALQQIAFLIKSDVGLEVAFAESGGWDTHVRQGSTVGSFAQRTRDLAGSIAAFWRDLGGHRDEVTLMTMTEFGRTVAENGAGGTDHGHGSAMFVLGGDVDGGKVHGEFPGLDPDVLYDGRDLPVMTDFRSVFAGVAGATFDLAEGAELFPGWGGRPLPVVKRS